MEETHTTHFVDAGEPIQDGVKITDEGKVTGVVYKRGAIVGLINQRMNGLMVLPPNRYWELIVWEAVIAKILKDNPDMKVEVQAAKNDLRSKLIPSTDSE